MYLTFQHSLKYIFPFLSKPIFELTQELLACNSKISEGYLFRPYKYSSNINEVIKIVLNFILFFYEKILHAQKSTKKHKKNTRNKKYKRHQKHQKHQKAQKTQKHKNITKQKHKNANKRAKIKNALKKHLRGRKSLIHLFAFLCLRRKNSLQ